MTRPKQPQIVQSKVEADVMAEVNVTLATVGAKISARPTHLRHFVPHP